MSNKKLKRTPEFLRYLKIVVGTVSKGSPYSPSDMRELEREVKDSWPLDYPNSTDHNDQNIEWENLCDAVAEKNEHLLKGGNQEDYFSHYSDGEIYTKEDDNRIRTQKLLEHVVRKYTPKTLKQKTARRLSNFFAKFA